MINTNQNYVNTTLQFYPIDWDHLVDNNIIKVANFLKQNKKQFIKETNISFALNCNLSLVINSEDRHLIGLEELNYKLNKSKVQINFKYDAKKLLAKYKSQLKTKLVKQENANLSELYDILFKSHTALFSEVSFIDYLVPKLNQENVFFFKNTSSFSDKHYFVEQVINYWQQYQNISTSNLNMLLDCAINLRNDALGHILFNLVEQYFDEHYEQIAKGYSRFCYNRLIKGKVIFANSNETILNLPLHIMVDGDVVKTLNNLETNPTDIKIKFEVKNEEDISKFTDILLQQLCLHNVTMYQYLNRFKSMISLNNENEMFKNKAKALSDNFNKSYFLSQLAEIFDLLLTC